MCANSPDQRRSLHAGHHQYPISNESNPGNIFGLCGLISGCVTRTVKRFSFVFFIHHCKGSYKSGSSVVLLSLYQCYIVLKRSKVGNCHCDSVISSEATKKTYKRKARISHFKTLPVNSFALAFPVYICLVVNNDYFASKPCTSVCTTPFIQD